MQLFQDFGGWAFVSEVTFEGGVVPEPATRAMMIGGLGLVGAATMFIAEPRRRGGAAPQGQSQAIWGSAMPSTEVIEVPPRWPPAAS